MNTRIIDAEYDYLAPQDWAEALDFAAGHPGVKVMAGGTDVLVKLKTGALPDLQYLLDLKRIDGLDYAREATDGSFHIGPLAKLSRLEQEPLILARYPALAAALQLMASISVRNMGTMAGNICNASPVADSVIPAICYNALLTLESRGRGFRTVPLEDFFLAPGVSVMESDELLADIMLPEPAENTGACFIKKSRVRPDIAKLTIGVKLVREGGSIRDCRIAMGAIAARPYFFREQSAALIGKEMTGRLIGETAAALADHIRPIDDNRTTAEYRKLITEVVAADALREAWHHAGGELE